MWDRYSVGSSREGCQIYPNKGSEKVFNESTQHIFKTLYALVRDWRYVFLRYCQRGVLKSGQELEIRASSGAKCEGTDLYRRSPVFNPWFLGKSRWRSEYRISVTISQRLQGASPSGSRRWQNTESHMFTHTAQGLQTRSRNPNVLQNLMNEQE